MDTQRSGDAAGAGGIPLSLLNRSSTTRAHTLSGAPAEGGLLATFDAIFRQTLAPRPSLHPVAPAAVDSAPAEDRRERLESRAASSEDDHLDEDREASASPQTPLAAQTPPTASDEPSSIAEESADDSVASDKTTAASAQADAESERPEDPSIESEQAAAEAAPVAQTVAAETGATVSEAPAASASATAAAADGGASPAAAADPAEAPPAETAPVAAGPVPSVQATQNPAEPTTPAQASAELASAAIESPTPESEPIPAEEAAVGEPAGDEVLPAAEDAGDQEGSTEQRPSRHQDGAYRGRGDRGDRGERNEGVATGEGKRAGRAGEAAAERPLDQLLAQMQPVDPATETAARPAAVPPPANAAAAAAAAAPPPATGPAAQASSSGGDSSAAESRLNLDGAEPRRGVGGLKSEAADGQTQTTSGAERVRLVQRVARAFQRLGPSGGRVQVMLHPAALGSVRLDLRIDGNRMDARMTAETEAARSVLREHLPELRQRLADSGLVVERIEIDLDSRSPDSQTTGDRAEQGSDHSEWRRSDPQSAPQRRNLPPSAPAPQRQAPAPHRTSTGLDLMA